MESETFAQKNGAIEADFGLSKQIPLNAESILIAAFKNTNRIKFPDFARQFWPDQNLCTQHKTPNSLIQTISERMPKAVEKFNNSKICLHKTNDFFVESVDGDHEGEAVDKSKYTKMLQESKWFGPYSSEGDEEGDINLNFYSINSSGSNEYFVNFEISI